MNDNRETLLSETIIRHASFFLVATEKVWLSEKMVLIIISAGIYEVNVPIILFLVSDCIVRA